MPFKSKAQERYLFAKHPKIAKEFASETKDMKALPEHVAGKKESKPTITILRKKKMLRG